jgi:ABC-type Na+ transport system ATPase subunit NatA
VNQIAAKSAAPTTATKAGSSGGPAVEIAHLRKAYGNVVAVDDASLSVTEGEIFGILGPNGAGKTTTVECAIGLRAPDAGTIRLLGLDPRADRDELRQVTGVQLQTSALPGRLRVGEILDMYRSFYRHPADVDELMEALGLAAKRRAFYRSLSGGQRQRLSVALALIGRPKIAVLDEMTTGLDPQARRDTWDLIEGVRDRVANEARLAWRQPGGLAAGVGFPLVLVVIFGELPAFGQPKASLGGLTEFDSYVPVLAVFAITILAIWGLPGPLASYREQGILRRLHTTPVPPSALLAAQLAVQLALAAAGLVTVFTVAGAAFGVPEQPATLAAGSALSIAGLFPLGLVIAALAPTADTASVIGRVAFFPLMFFAGLWLPRPLMPGALRDISDYTPVGAAAQALQDAMQGQFPRPRRYWFWPDTRWPSPCWHGASSGGSNLTPGEVTGYCAPAWGPATTCYRECRRHPSSGRPARTTPTPSWSAPGPAACGAPGCDSTAAAGQTHIRVPPAGLPLIGSSTCSASPAKPTACSAVPLASAAPPRSVKKARRSSGQPRSR